MVTVWDVPNILRGCPWILIRSKTRSSRSLRPAPPWILFQSPNEYSLKVSHFNLPDKHFTLILPDYITPQNTSTPEPLSWIMSCLCSDVEALTTVFFSLVTLSLDNIWGNLLYRRLYRCRRFMIKVFKYIVELVLAYWVLEPLHFCARLRKAPKPHQLEQFQ